MGVSKKMRSILAGTSTSTALFAGGLLVPVIASVIIVQNALNIPVGDEWWWVLLVYQDHLGGVHFGDVWTQHNEHRIVFPTLLMLALERFGGYNVVREIGVNFVLALLTLLSLITLIRRTLAVKTMSFFFAITSLFIFSMTQYENWNWGFQIAWFLVNLCAVLVVLLLSQFATSLPALLVAAACAVIASFSVSSGLDLWIAGTFILLASTPIRWSRVAIWVALSVTCFVSYLHGYVKPSYHPSTTAFLSDPIGFLTYIFTYLGSPLAITRSSIGVLPAGGAIVAMFVAFVVVTARLSKVDAERRNAAVAWLGLAIFSALSSVMTAIGRFGFGVDQAFSSRYVTVSSMFWLGTLGAGFVLLKQFNFLQRLPYRQSVAFALVIAFSGSYIAANKNALTLELDDKEHHLRAYAALEDLSYADDVSLSYAFPDVKAVRVWANLLKQVHEGPYH